MSSRRQQREQQHGGRFGMREIAAAMLCANVVRKSYRYREHGHSYTIEYRREADGTWTLWAIDRPYNPYTDLTGHLYSTGEICVDKDHKPRSLDKAIAISIYWMNRYSAYVTTGTFPQTSGRVNV